MTTPAHPTGNRPHDPKPPDSQRAGDKQKASDLKVGEQKPAEPLLKGGDKQSEESKKLRRENPVAAGTSGPVGPDAVKAADPKHAIEIAEKADKLIKDTPVEDQALLNKQVQRAIKLNTTVARASQLRRRPDPEVEYPTNRLDPKLKDIEAQVAVQTAGGTNP